MASGSPMRIMQVPALRLHVHQELRKLQMALEPFVRSSRHSRV
eukprot:CAMPEP_0119341106 /NCGR_PEP_ID=MMETSP1333-20130426/101671_1 /TAXON_ID=418940 /ORGANISM="Scyphosphaera apsteinii, Strain RCC1455" /LENGTH=42 /DNA_ID= /DNA_START= /DNA_END= /DNA_ORIENTATION=